MDISRTHQNDTNDQPTSNYFLRARDQLYTISTRIYNYFQDNKDDIFNRTKGMVSNAFEYTINKADYICQSAKTNIPPVASSVSDFAKENMELITLAFASIVIFFAIRKMIYLRA